MHKTVWWVLKIVLWMHKIHEEPVLRCDIVRAHLHLLASYAINYAYVHLLHSNSHDTVLKTARKYVPWG